MIKKTKMSYEQIIKQVPPNYYQEGIEHNILQRVWHIRRFKAVCGLIRRYPKKILDVGCASGWFLSQLSKLYPKAKCYGVDVYDNAIAYGAKLYPEINFKVADAHRLPFEDNTFDLVVCTSVLEHVDDPQSVLLEIKRVLKQRGVAVIELDSGSVLFTIAWFLWKRFKGSVWHHAHLHSFTVKKLKSKILSCGFTIIKKKKFSWGMAMAFLIEKNDNESQE